MYRRGPYAERVAEFSPPGSLACRIHGWTWQSFSIGMGTSAVYVTLNGLKDHSPAVTTLETIFFVLNVLFFLFNVFALTIQAFVYPQQAVCLIMDPVTGVFVPLMVLSFATIVIGSVDYAIPVGLLSPNFVYAFFWLYTSLSLVICIPMLMIWFNKTHDVTQFTPAYMFLIFPMMFVGVVAFNVLDVLDPSEPRAIGVLLTGYFFQGVGFFMTFFYLSIYILRIMTTGFLSGPQANGAFVACGPPGFTALALVNLAGHARVILPHARQNMGEEAGEIWYAVSVLAALLLYSLAIFFFLFALLPYFFKLHKKLDGILGCWAVTFPNVGWIATTRDLGDVFDLQGFYTLHMIMSVLMLGTWIVLVVLTVKAIWLGKITKSSLQEVVRDRSGFLKLQTRDAMEDSDDEQSSLYSNSPKQDVSFNEGKLRKDKSWSSGLATCDDMTCARSSSSESHSPQISVDAELARYQRLANEDEIYEQYDDAAHCACLSRRSSFYDYSISGIKGPTVRCVSSPGTEADELGASRRDNSLSLST
ncbi:hypothetical protein CYLTODRAFT_418429 [Cylindrobasidium torrendii FP15055 ss-10]|uniref:C4-dicarboxylate transporter/malic acid transport protein n=1 Tax=Cylindrobasidium torrendii FP15055 ss-10 TaxID=1314674 RepID=A0A0D7BN56_9AGAR|nr:hypothetical protein CYLTODRAFT_418429 [Cylindrobasidium torrendii FP15055 ss-10]